MEKEPTKKSCSKYLKLNINEDLKEYVGILDKITNNPQKYQKINNLIMNDPHGDPYVIVHYAEIPDEEERRKKKVSFFAEILTIPVDLKRFDSLMESFWNKEITVTFVEDFKHQEKDFFYLYKLIVYFVSTEKKSVEDNKSGV